MQYVKLHDDARSPRRGSEGAAGFDLAAVEDVVLQVGQRVVVKTGLAVKVPPGTYGRVAPRSGLAVKHGVDVLAGVVDADYRGEVGVVLVNLGASTVTLEKGDRIAQLIIERIDTNEATAVQTLDGTMRGAGGFGSSGK